MADRRVTKSGKDTDGDITKLCNPGAEWSPVSKADAVRHISNKIHTYYVQQPGTKRTDIHVYDGKHLRTDPDGDDENNLDNLPDC